MNKLNKIAEIDKLLHIVEDAKLIIRQNEEAATRLESSLKSARELLVGRPERTPRGSTISDKKKLSLVAGLTKKNKKTTPIEVA